MFRPVAVTLALAACSLAACRPAARAGCGDPGAAPCGPAQVPAPLRLLLIPQVGPGWDFRPACARHDRCYTLGYRDEFGRTVSRRQCDRRFLADLNRACAAVPFPRLCRCRARLDYAAVRVFGASAYGTP